MVIQLPAAAGVRAAAALPRAPLLAARGDGIIVSHNVKIFGIGEGTMEYQLRDLMNEMRNPTLAPYAKEGECLVPHHGKGPHGGRGRGHDRPVPRARSARARRLRLRR